MVELPYDLSTEDGCYKTLGLLADECFFKNKIMEVKCSETIVEIFYIIKFSHYHNISAQKMKYIEPFFKSKKIV